LAIPLTNTLNEVTSSKASRLSAIEDRLPTIVVLQLFTTAIVAMTLTGWRHGAVGRRQRFASACVVLLFALVVYVILDLDQPGRGLIRVSQTPMERLIASMEK